ncbi:hypothetical protein BJV78DRAFT_1172780 [Lactifluus subvellereus]|nr:hypothetical protein BJV78DRAFT_1172780 [Lactifluus subvellereus]
MHKTINTLIGQLKSEGVKERHAAIASLRIALARDGVVTELDKSPKRLGWLALFQALFTAVLNEKFVATHGSKSTSAAKRRVAEAASAVRWLTERCVHQLTHKNVIKALLNHLVQTSSYQGNLYLPVALDYTKAIRCVLDYPPHLEHIDDEMWVKLAELCFNVVLGDPLRKELILEEDIRRVVGSDPIIESDEDGDDSPATSAKIKKRRRREGSGTPGPSIIHSATPRTQPRPVSLEQVEFASLLSLLLTSSSAPLLSTEFPTLGSAVLDRLLRFLHLYPADSSLHPDFIVVLSSTLSHLALNKRDAVTRFAQGSWDALLGMWGTKNKVMKENLIIVLRTLFPIYTTRYPEAGFSSLDFSYVDGVSRLWHLLDGEAESRWGVDGLSLDSLRLSLTNGSCVRNQTQTGAFVARTFQYGWDFDANQATSWTILELQADCAEKLHTLTESFHSQPPTLTKREGKRVKFDSPVVSLLHAIQSKSTPAVRSYHLQVLLFLIDRHWAVLHESLQQSILSHLLQFVSCDDALIQSWVFLCLAAIAENQGSSWSIATSLSPLATPQTWDPIWTHAIRRVDVPIVSRSACHVAYALLFYARHLLTTQRVLLEVEAFAKDMDVQGPPFPYDSVCAFVALCLQVANQDMRLYRMRIEDKVLSWLADCYSLHAVRALRGGLGSGKSRTSRPLASDVTLVLGSACSLQRRTTLPCRMLLPESVIVNAVKEDYKTVVIRDFLLRARLPVFTPTPLESSLSDSLSSTHTTADKAGDLVSPGPRERKVSTILLKVLEDADAMDGGSTLSAERARRIVDFSVVALSFEGLLNLNGTLPNRRVLHAACKAASSIAHALTSNKWTLEEKALVLLGFDPLVHVAENDDVDPWIGLLQPNLETGIRREVLHRLVNINLDKEPPHSSLHRELQRVIWQIPEVTDFLTQVMGTMKTTLRVVLARITGRPFTSDGMEAEDHDDFASMGATITIAPVEAQRHTNGRIPAEAILEVCMSFLAVGPILQSSGEEPTRDRELTDIVLNCDGDEFLLASKAYLVNVCRQTLNINVTTLDNLLVKFASLSTQYIYQLNDELKLMIIRLLDSTAHLWTLPDLNGSDTIDKVRNFFGWLLKLVRVSNDEDGNTTGTKVRSWRIRDAFVAFLARYMALDPFERIWATQLSSNDDDDPDSTDGFPILPSDVLPTINQDDDIRVRFRSAYATATLFNLGRFNSTQPMAFYGKIHTSLCRKLDMYEHMLTRFLTLGNIMVVSSAVRRGPYWHILETSYHSDNYNSHIMAVFRGVSDRLGLSDASQLFKVYIFQIAYSIFSAGLDFLRCPPNILGYNDRRACAESALHAFAPIYFLPGDHDSERVPQGRRSFVNHCQAAQISVVDGYRDTFANLVGYELVSSMDEITVESSSFVDWRPTVVDQNWLGNISFEDQMANNVDGIVVVVLRTLGDQEHQNIAGELGSQAQREGHVFRALTAYRILEDLKTHDANLPSFGTATILRALKWLSDHVPDTDSASTTYHVIQQLLAGIQESPLVNEQLRCMNALCLWISCHFRHFRDPVLLHTLIHGVTSLLEQIDLALAAKSILEWAFSQFAKVTEKDSRLANVLIRLCCVANEHAGSKNPTTAKIGVDLLHWLEGQMLQLAKFSSVKNQVVKAFPAWPREPSPELVSACKDVSAQILSSVLSDLRITSNKFTVVRRLSTVSLGEYSQEQFSRVDFWRLKDCIPSSQQLQAVDIDAFASLLLLHKGQIHSFGLNPLSGQVPKNQQTRMSRSKALKSCAVDSSPMAERSILELLLAMLDSDMPSKVHMAYRVLCTLPSKSLPDFESWTAEHSAELGYFRGCSRRSVIRSPAQLHVLLASDVYVNMAQDFQAWITSFATLLCDVLVDHRPFYSQLPTILQVDPDFAEQITPILVHILLSTSISDATTNESPRAVLSQFFSRVLNSTLSDVSSRRAIVSIVLHLRHLQPPRSDDELAYDKWLDLDFLLLSKSAILSGAYTTALLFHELAMEYLGPDVASPSSADTENILFDIYSHIEEPDGFYGIKTQDLHHFLLKRFHHEHQWEKAFKFHGAALEARNQGGVDTEGVLHSLYSFGFDTLALSVQQNVFDASNLGATSSNMVYHLGWRTETWDLPDQASSLGSGTALYNALRAVSRERDPQIVDTVVRKALLDEIDHLRALGDEDLVGIREVARNIMCLHQVNSQRTDLQECLNSGMLDSILWSKFSEIDSDFDFPVLENIVATRISLLHSARHKEQRQQIGTAPTPLISGLMDIEKQCLIRISEAARESHNLQVALNSVIRAQKLERSPSALVSQEFTNVLWVQREHKVAVQSLKDLIRLHFPDIKSETAQDHAQKASLLARLGSWTSEACLEKPMDIWTHYFRPAASLVTELMDTVDRPKTSVATVYHQCAVFADRQYHAILRSPDAIKWKLYAERKEKEIQHRKDQMSRTQSNSMAYRELKHDQEKAERLLREDMQRYRKHSESLSTFLKQAIDMYSWCLQTADDFDNDSHIRLVSLWFANFNDNDLQDEVRPSIDRIPSRKFVFLAHQLSARLAKPANDPVTGSQDTLQSLILRMCREHPFHSLYQVYCLRPSPGVTNGGRRSSARLDLSLSQGERAAAAADIFDRLRADPSSNQRLIDVERVCDVCLQWAKRPIKGSVDKARSGPYEIPNDMLILKLRDVRVPVLTVNTPVDPTLQYQNCIWVSHYEKNFETAGGINIPKICYCRGSDGVKYKQLFKGEGNDDLRQDAVMEQVFDLVNAVLCRDRETRRRNLSIRGYKVIPLAPQAGVLEFVGNTLPVSHWLTRAHLKYNKGDIPPQEFYGKMYNMREENKSSPSLSSKLITLFLSLRGRFKPVMRHFFTEKHKTPMSWFAMRLNYTRSVATTSIVGHILGLGDRHTSNILLDNGTGEVVHIDLGIAFEQGKLLGVPECVPFRMTADMVDGMGTTGTQGVFQRCAEETLRVLRDDSEVILTVLEVFKYDPLHSWTASEFKIKRAQGWSSTTDATASRALTPGPGGVPELDMSSGTADEAADRALTAVARKLDRALSTEYTVNELIAEATDLVNLACMFIGWSPHL